MVWVETPTNPMLKVTDIQRTAEIAHKHGAILVVDNTFMSPFFQRPLSLGADIAVHSVSKYINGHTDVVGGVLVVNSEELHKKLRFLQNGKSTKVKLKSMKVKHKSTKVKVFF